MPKAALFFPQPTCRRPSKRPFERKAPLPGAHSGGTAADDRSIRSSLGTAYFRPPCHPAGVKEYLSGGANARQGNDFLAKSILSARSKPGRLLRQGPARRGNASGSHSRGPTARRSRPPGGWKCLESPAGIRPIRPALIPSWPIGRKLIWRRQTIARPWPGRARRWANGEVRWPNASRKCSNSQNCLPFAAAAAYNLPNPKESPGGRAVGTRQWSPGGCRRASCCSRRTERSSINV
jgi:hypothetical protein